MAATVEHHRLLMNVPILIGSVEVCLRGKTKSEVDASRTAADGGLYTFSEITCS